MATKISFGSDGSVKTEDNYKLSADDLRDIESSSNDDDGLDEEERIAEIESEMEPQKLRAWLQAKAKGMSIDDFLGENSGAKKKVTAPKENKIKGHSRQPSKTTMAKRRMGRQETVINCRDKEAMKRTYVIELANLKKLEEIKVFLYQDEIIQLSEIVNDAIEHYYDCLKEKK